MQSNNTTQNSYKNNVKFLEIFQNSISDSQLEKIANEHFSRIVNTLELQGFVLDEQFCKGTHLAQGILTAEMFRSYGKFHPLQLLIDEFFTKIREED